jgi:hypothetical protein
MERGRVSPVADVLIQQRFGHEAEFHSMAFACKHGTF